MTPDVTVIVVNHNRANLLAACLQSLLRQTWARLEVLVVDNGSTDRSHEVVQSLESGRIRWVPLTTNCGFAAANNVGIGRALGDFIAVLNNDAEASPRWIEALMQPMRTGDRIGMCASKILLVKSGRIDKVGHLMFADGQNRGRGTGEVDLGQFEIQEEAFFPDGCAALYRKSALDEVGGFDEDFFAYGDDADLGIRLRWKGWHCVYVPEAVVQHQHSATSGAYSPQKIYWVERNRMWLAVKNFPLPLLLFNPLFTGYRWLWNLGAGVLGTGAAGQFRSQNSWRLLFATLLRAYRDGVRGIPSMWKKRKHIRVGRRISDSDFYRLMRKYRVSARTLALRNPPAP